MTQNVARVVVAGVVGLTTGAVGVSLLESSPIISPALAQVAPFDYISAIGALKVQHDSIALNMDSLKIESCRGGTLLINGTCSGRKYAPRTTVMYRIAQRVGVHVYRSDSILNKIAVALTPPANVGWTARHYDNSDRQHLPNVGVDTVTRCAVFENASGRKVLGWPPVRYRVAADSTLATVNLRGGNPLAIMCAMAMMRENLTLPDSLAVVWTVLDSIPLGTRYVSRPFASLP